MPLPSSLRFQNGHDHAGIVDRYHGLDVRVVSGCGAAISELGLFQPKAVTAATASSAAFVRTRIRLNGKESARPGLRGKVRLCQ